MQNISMSQAYLAIVQHIKEFYDVFAADLDLAMVPAWVNASPLTDHVSQIEPLSAKAALQHEYELSRFVNALQQHPHLWTDDGDSLGTIYREVLHPSNSDVTSPLLQNWRDATVALEEVYTYTNTNNESYEATTVDQTPRWNTNQWGKADILALFERAKKEEDWFAAYQHISSPELDGNLDVESLSFEIAKVKVERPWYQEELINSRQWRLKPSATINGKSFLSSTNEQDAFAGALPAYPASFVLIRNFKLQLVNVPDEKDQQDENSNIIDEENSGDTSWIYRFGSILLQGNIFQSLKLGENQLRAFSPNHQVLQTVKANLKLQYVLAVDSGVLKGGELKLDHKTKLTLKPEVIKPGEIKFKDDRLTIKPNKTYDFALSSESTVSSEVVPLMKIKVLDDRGKSIQGAKLLISATTTTDVPTVILKTDANGEVKLKLDSGLVYRIICEKEGYLVRSLQLEVPKEGGLSVMDIYLEAKPEKRSVQKVAIEKKPPQLLAVVYYKLKDVPNPIEDFESFEEVDI